MISLSHWGMFSCDALPAGHMPIGYTAVFYIWDEPVVRPTGSLWRSCAIRHMERYLVPNERKLDAAREFGQASS